MDFSISNYLHYFQYDEKHPLMFNSPVFLFLFLIFYLFYIYRKEGVIRNTYLLIFSVYLYYLAGGEFVCLLVASAIGNYLLSLFMCRYSERHVKKRILVITIIINLLVLGYYKYTNFFIDNANLFLGSDVSSKFNFVKIVLPVGISFYTFQTISYHIDLFREEVKPVNNIIDFAFFVTYFPQLVAGPIVRAKEFIPQMYKKLTLDKQQMSLAIYLILWGLIKKSVISDYISVNFVDRIFDSPLSYSPIENLLACYGYAIQIYCDFSGYSDMAIGLALLMGFRLPINFRTPYQSVSVTEFWQRWHISLSSWLKDYLYIPLGGNRKGIVRTYINLILTMLIGGLWHGAAWKFVIWGGLHGVLLAIERFIKKIFNIQVNIFTRLLGLLFTFHFVVFCWIFFKASSMSSAWEMITHIFSIKWDPMMWISVLLGYKYVFILLGIAFICHFSPERSTIYLQKQFQRMPWPLQSVVIALVFWLVYITASAGIQPFIYLQF